MRIASGGVGGQSCGRLGMRHVALGLFVQRRGTGGAGVARRRLVFQRVVGGAVETLVAAS